MRNRDHFHIHRKKREHHPMIGIGIFFIVLGVALLIATNDLLNLGSIGSYFNWRTAMIFVGVLLLLNLEFPGGFLLIAGGIWFMQDELFPFAEEKFDTFFWPVVIGFVGLSFILSALFKRKSIRKNNL
jgi:hypothetical protein